MFLLKAFGASSVISTALSTPNPVVDLGYSVYEGLAQSNGLNQFLGIRFAAPPLGNLRFRRPLAPLQTIGMQQAKDFGPICFGVGEGVSNGQSEDCLFLNVWAPSDATPNSKLPVFFWIQGGGYNANSNSNYNGSDLIQATGNNMVFVNFNYRVGPFGFLASERIRSSADLNAGLLDQRFALQWVQQHIATFGGDPGHVVLVGASAGAGSAALHMLAFNGAPTNLFHGVFGVSPFFPAQLRPAELEWQFDTFATRAGCGPAPNALICLRALNSTVLQNANQEMPYPGRTSNSLFPFTPTIDGDFLVDFPYRMLQQGRYVKVPVVFGDDTDEGTGFAVNATSPTQVASFMQDNFPRLTANNTAAINALYPLRVPNPYANHAHFFASAVGAFGETTFICPGVTLSSALSKFTRSWNYRYNVLIPGNAAAGIGVPHTSELPNVFGPGNTPAGSSVVGFDFDDISLTPILQAYYTSFVRSLDPNAFPVAGTVPWPMFDDKTNRRLLLQVNATNLETVPQTQLARCEFWRGLGVQLEQ